MVERWDILTIGNLSRNRYWGESELHAYRPPLCTSTLVGTDEFTLLVDPSLEDAQQMALELDRRHGLKPAAVDLVFVTHPHGDHHAGLRHFPHARWLAAGPVAEAINHRHGYTKRVEPVGAALGPDIEVLATPGHTPDHHSLRFDCDGLSVVIAGDAVMTRDFFRHRQGYFNSVAGAVAAQTIAHLAEIADIIVPGHDNYFLTRRQPLARAAP